MEKTPPNGRIALAELMTDYTRTAVLPDQLAMVAEGASGRCIMRCSLPVCSGIIGIFWTPDRADNASFLTAADGLLAAGVPVPRVFARRALPNDCGACLVEDLGEQSLLSLRTAPRAARLAACAAALRTMQAFHAVRVDWPLQPPFDASLYTWEQAYFAEHLLGRHLGRPSATSFAQLPAARALADWLDKLPRCPVHRDFQSQNIILRDGVAYCIDFQGMRLGLPEYDLASLLYDPYMELTDDDRAELLAQLATMSGSQPRHDVLQACALQRLMQALGAYANIGYNQHKEWYLQLIPTALRTLRELCATISPDSPAHPLVPCLLSAI